MSMFMSNSVDSYEVLRMPTLVEGGYEVVETAQMAMSQRFIACLNNERMTDVILVGEDGNEVPACKFILGSASTNLQTLFYGGKEPKSTIHFPRCREKALRALVEYSCSDLLNTNIWSDTEPVEIVEDMVALAKLAETYTLPNLKQQVSDVLCPCLDQLPSLACVAFNLVDTKSTAELHAASLKVLRKKPYQAFVKGPGGEIGGIACLSPEKLDLIFRDQEVNAEEIFLFQCLQEWRASNSDKYSNAKQVCKRVAMHLDYSAIHASDIENIVLPSGIVDASSLVSGLMTLAKAAEKKGVTCRSARSKHAHAEKIAAEPNSESNITAGKGKSRGRRFRKSVHALTTTETEQEVRDDSLSPRKAPAEKEVKAPIRPEESSSTPTMPTNPVKKNFNGMRFRSPNFVKAGATRLFGTLRHIKESVSESRSHDTEGPVNIPPAVKTHKATKGPKLPKAPKNAKTTKPVKPVKAAKKEPELEPEEKREDEDDEFLKAVDSEAPFSSSASEYSSDCSVETDFEQVHNKQSITAE